MDASIVGVVISGAVAILSLGGTYGMLKGSLNSFIQSQIETNKALWKRIDTVETRLHNHIEKKGATIE